MKWTKLNLTFDAEPNAPAPQVSVVGRDIRLVFYLNPFIWPDVHEEDKGCLLFHDCLKYRLGSTNMDGFYFGQSKYSNTGIQWGDFYVLEGLDIRGHHTDYDLDINMVSLR